LVHAFLGIGMDMYRCGDKGLKLAQLLGQLGVVLTCHFD
jgi:hypothetical protein